MKRQEILGRFDTGNLKDQHTLGRVDICQHGLKRREQKSMLRLNHP